MPAPNCGVAQRRAQVPLSRCSAGQGFPPQVPVAAGIAGDWVVGQGVQPSLEDLPGSGVGSVSHWPAHLEKRGNWGSVTAEVGKNGY